jgi:hypothetical protein
LSLIGAELSRSGATRIAGAAPGRSIYSDKMIPSASIGRRPIS